MPQSSKSSKSELQLRALDRRVRYRGKTRTYWWICSFTPEGKKSKLAGWESIQFTTYSRCVAAINFVETCGGSYFAWREWLRSK